MEPDVFIQFEVGDPSIHIDLIVEAKLGGAQYAHQWYRQWEALRARNAPNEEQFAGTRKVYLLAIGGVGSSAAELAARLKSEILTVSDGKTALTAAAADWSRLYTALSAIDIFDSHTQRIVDDIRDALSLFGFRQGQELNTLGNFETMQNADQSLSVIRSLFWRA